MTKKLTEEQKREREENRRKARLAEMSRRGHEPGTRHAVDGVSYVVMPNGEWLRVTKKPHESKAAFEAKLERARTKFPPHSNRTKAVV